MTRTAWRCCTWAVALIALVLSGCEDGSDPNRVGPNVGGQWSGQYYITDGSHAPEQLVANVIHKGSEVFIATTREGIASTFTGTIDAEGNMRMTDTFDDQTWTTFYGPATSTHMILADYLFGSGGDDPPLAVLELVR